eukprot:9253279-Ditylum_brightwellii.AAC.1
MFGWNKVKEMHRVRKDLEKDTFLPLGDYYFRRSYGMKKKNFYKLHSVLEPYLCCCFSSKDGGIQDPNSCSYVIKTETRLSIAVCYFAGGSPLDIILTHGVSFASVYNSVWGVVDCVNK